MPYSEPESYLEEIQDSMLELVKLLKETNYMLHLLVSNSYENLCNEVGSVDTDEKKSDYASDALRYSSGPVFTENK